MEQKIKVNLSFRDYEMLLSDMWAFGFVDENGKERRNRFINELIRNFAVTEGLKEDRLSSLVEEALRDLGTIKERNAAKDSILNAISLTHDGGFLNSSLPCSLSFRPSKEYERTFSFIDANLLKNRSESSFYRDLFHHYLSLSMAEREAIIFAPNVDYILEAMKKSHLLRFKIGGKPVDFAPFAMRTTKEEYMIYVIGLVDMKAVYSFHLYKLSELTLTNHGFVFSSEDKKRLEEASSSSIEYAKGDVIKASIRLSPQGIRTFNRVWHNRPEPVLIDEDTYHFESPSYQLYNYFSRFGKEALVLSPKPLADKLSLFYSEASEAYKKQ